MAPYSVYECYFTMGVIFVLDFGRKRATFFRDMFSNICAAKFLFN